jgi:HAD superfamily hydrolase (TIGR01509 family)
MATSDLRAVIFDMDGLLADTEPLSYRAWTALIARDYGVVPTEEDAAWATATVGKHWPEVWRMIAERFRLPVELPRDLARLNGAYREIYNDILAQGVPPLPGAVELVALCRASALLVGLASSSAPDQIERVLQSIGIRDQFAAIASGSEVPRSKPDPAIYLLACERLGVPPREAVALEDSGPGVMAAHAAGLRCLAIPSHFTAAHDFSLASDSRPTLVGLTVADLAALPWR